MSDHRTALREAFTSILRTGRSMLSQLQKSRDDRQILRAIHGVARPHASISLLLQGMEKSRKSPGHLGATIDGMHGDKGILIEIVTLLDATAYVMEHKIKLDEFDAAETGRWLEVAYDIKQYLIQCNDLVVKLADAPNKARREIEQNAGDSWINQFDMDSASRSARAILVSSAQLSEYANSSGDVDDEISVAIYLDTDDKVVEKTVVQQIRELIDVLGYGEGGDAIVERGSLFRRSWARLRKGLTSTEVRQRLVKVERALEIALIEERQADADSKEAQAVGQLLGSLELFSQACMRIGSIFLIKYQGSQGPIILVRNLSQLEIRALERFPEIQQNPQKALQSLSLAIAQLDDLASPDLDLES